MFCTDVSVVTSVQTLSVNGTIIETTWFRRRPKSFMTVFVKLRCNLFLSLVINTLEKKTFDPTRGGYVTSVHTKRSYICIHTSCNILRVRCQTRDISVSTYGWKCFSLSNLNVFRDVRGRISEIRAYLFYESADLPLRRYHYRRTGTRT